MKTSRLCCRIVSVVLSCILLLPPAPMSALARSAFTHSEETATLTFPATLQSTDMAEARVPEAYGRLPLSSPPPWSDPALAPAQRSGTQSIPNELVYNEEQTVYLTNLKRAAHGVPPLRWNRQLTEAARWFSWDSVENRPGGYCGHQDTNGQWPSDRASLFGYNGFAGAENCFCGYVTPEQAVEGWYNETPPNDGHRQNMLDPNSWEVGLGYYRRDSDGRGYVTQDFGVDSAYPPVIINNEAIQTNNPTVNLYIYSNSSSGGITGLGPATEMMVSNDPCFLNATWEAYSAYKSWTLEPGTGWRTVYVKTRDASGRSTVAKDTIYLGPSIPYQDLGLEQASTRSGQVNLYKLNGGGLPFMQFSLGWLVEMETGTLWWGNGEVVADPDASAGQAYRLRPGNGNSFVWVTPTDYPRNLNSQVYFRLKVNDNSVTTTVARISVSTNGVERDFLELKGTDFAAPGVYQEFPLDFVQYDDPSYPWLILGVDRQGEATVYADRVVAFTAPEPVQASKTWDVPGGNYRGGTVWVRYTNNAGAFSAIAEAITTRSQLQVSPTSLSFMGEYTTTVPAIQTLTVGYGEGCDRPPWSAHSSHSWLKVITSTPYIQVWVDPTGLPTGIHHATLTVDAGPDILDSPQTIPVVFTLVDQLGRVFLPLIIK